MNMGVNRYLLVTLLFTLSVCGFAQAVKADAVLCSPGADASACKPPSHPSLGIFYGMPPSSLKPVTNSGPGITNYYLSHQEYGACALTYDNTNSKYGCEGGVDPRTAGESLSALKAAAGNNSRLFVTYTFSTSAADQVNQKNDAYNAALFIYQHTTQLTGIDGILLDYGPYLDPENTPPPPHSLLNPSGQKLAEELSLLLPNESMLNITGGIVGKIAPGPGEDYSYDWNFWTAINRSNKACSKDSYCQMGLFIYPLYDKIVNWYPFSNLRHDGENQAFNLDIRNFPFQMRLVSEFAAEVSGYVYKNANTHRLVSSTLKPVSVGSQSFGPPFGYYQLGVMASGSVHTGASIFSFNKASGSALVSGSRDYWGANDPPSAVSPPSAMSVIGSFKCGGRLKAVSTCEIYRQIEQIPTPDGGGVNKGDFTLQDVVNQYVCTQLNAITYVYSNYKDDLIVINKPKYFCNIGEMKIPNEPKTDPTKLQTFDGVTARTEQAIHGQPFVNVVFPFRQGDFGTKDGYGTMVGPALYRISTANATLINKCLSIYNQHGGVPTNDPWFSSNCTLLPGVGSVPQGNANGTLEMFLDWYQSNADTASWYIPYIPGYDTQKTK